MNHFSVTNRRLFLYDLLKAAVVILMAKVLIAIVYEYRGYLPADFETGFLMGRRFTFHGAYRTAFYVHIIVSPLTIILGAFLMLSGRRWRHSRLHRILGRIQIACVLFAVVPSGLVMSMQAYTGPLAGSGFAVQAWLTAISAIVSVHHVRAGRIECHRRWVSRCYILLCSPLILRVLSGMTISMGVDNDWTYRLTAWISWLIPLIVFECWGWSNREKHVLVKLSSRRVLQKA